jgi:hypothetical protein
MHRSRCPRPLPCTVTSPRVQSGGLELGTASSAWRTHLEAGGDRTRKAKMAFLVTRVSQELTERQPRGPEQVQAENTQWPSSRGHGARLAAVLGPPMPHCL